MADGFRWLIGHPPMRTLALTIFAFNVTFGAAWSVLVLYASERLGMGPVGFGLLTTAVAVGGIDRDRLVRPTRATLLARRHHARRPAHRDGHPPVARADDVRGGRARDARRVRRPRVRVGHDLDGRPSAGRPGRDARSGDRRLPGRHRRRDGHRDADRRPARRDLRDHGPVLVRVRRLGAPGRVLWRQFDLIVHAGEESGG